ncbi:MAG: HNH endonuclease signature motif containing protein [Ilumatobacter sp.]|uniref:HNH endonuclease signature motif containing protein n=1 Tax=Ilumatobacter sp. TaxID=1967498 RepID=UPI00329741D6
MTPAALADRARHNADVRARSRGDAAAVRSAMVAVREISGWADAQNAALVGLLASLDSFPEAAIAEVSRGSLSDASKIKERADTIAGAPSIAEALEHGSITVGHVDAITRGSKRLEPEQRQAFVDRAESLADVAAAATVAEFTRRLNLEITRMRSDDGEARLIRQRRDTRLSTWTDDDGMWNLRGRFDPVAGIGMSSRLNDAVESLFTEQVPELCPSDPLEKDKFLRAHALARLLTGGTATGASANANANGGDQMGGAEPGGDRRSNGPTPIGRGSARSGAVLAVIDVDAPATCECGGRSTDSSVEWPIPVEVPYRVLAELAAGAEVVGVVVRNGVVLHAPGTMNLGRSTRLASRDQRRALRGLYRGCAVPGCAVGFDRCKIHHVVWWRNGGLTDLSNLLPICAQHHSRLHADEWLVELGPNRELSITLPDGKVMSTGPPSRNAA